MTLFLSFSGTTADVEVDVSTPTGPDDGDHRSSPNVQDAEVASPDSPQPTGCDRGEGQANNFLYSRLGYLNVINAIDPTRFSSLDKLLRVTSYVVRFVCGLRGGGPISASEMDRAENMWVVSVQQEETRKNTNQTRNTVLNLGLFEDKDRILRCNGRIKKSDLPYDVIHPIFLPYDSYFTDLIVFQAHEIVHHQRIQPTLTQVRSRFWIPRGRQKVKSVIKPCRLCRIFDGHALQLPSPPPLPQFRLDCSRPFMNCGIDHLGPVYVKDVFTDSGTHKAYIALFSCATTRAVHLELQSSLTAPRLIDVLKRSFARIGTPNFMISDQHKTFKSSTIQNFAASCGIAWELILERSPHWGGFYESMVKIVKRALLKSVGKRCLTYEQLYTFIVQIEGVINSRPLCYTPNDSEYVAITPSHLLHGRRILDRSVSSMDKSADLGTRYKSVKSAIASFWRQFQTDYLLQLRNKERWTPTRQSVAVGDLVLVSEKFTARCEWEYGVVTRLVSSKADSVPRGAELRLSDGRMLNRPINRLHPVECNSSD